MELDVISPGLLILAISLSWNRFACIFSSASSVALAAAPLTTAATAISLSALGLAFAGNTPWFGFLIVLAGVLASSIVKRQPAAITVALSAISLAAYLSFSPVQM
ncbi:hypothetical protein PWG15_35195 (plasmid) [Ensifer adhaerens]|uniref:hypothetical protein n=1 Tax=Ensifer adhaerens TaxID=106592 RepID=UPI0023A9C887|nr:hypothetical protein [Ensifer adhaerens]WDZ81586.1 hypothetical protein PWG15_35195 [Ensifer adhaerens]